VVESIPLGFAAPQTTRSPSVRLVVPLRLRIPVARSMAVQVGGTFGLALLRERFQYETAEDNVPHALASAPLVTAALDVSLSLPLP
jgi:hypothetical protein